MPILEFASKPATWWAVVVYVYPAFDEEPVYVEPLVTDSVGTTIQSLCRNQDTSTRLERGRDIAPLRGYIYLRSCSERIDSEMNGQLTHQVYIMS